MTELEKLAQTVVPPAWKSNLIAGGMGALKGGLGGAALGAFSAEEGHRGEGALKGGLMGAAAMGGFNALDNHMMHFGTSDVSQLYRGVRNMLHETPSGTNLPDNLIDSYMDAGRVPGGEHFQRILNHYDPPPPPLSPPTSETVSHGMVPAGDALKQGYELGSQHAKLAFFAPGSVSRSNLGAAWKPALATAAVGAGMGALTADEGQGWSGALKGGLAGAAVGGAVGAGHNHMMNHAAPGDFVNAYRNNVNGFKQQLQQPAAATPPAAQAAQDGMRTAAELFGIKVANGLAANAGSLIGKGLATAGKVTGALGGNFASGVVGGVGEAINNTMSAGPGFGNKAKAALGGFASGMTSAIPGVGLVAPTVATPMMNKALGVQQG